MKKLVKMLTFVLAFAMVVTTMSVMAGCGEKKAVLVVNTMFGAGDAHEATFLRTNNAFEDKNNIKIKNNSGIATNSTWLNSFSADMGSTSNMPDVVFYFSGAAMDAFRSKVVTVDEIKKEFPNFVKNITVHDTDPASIEMKAGAQAIMYNADVYSEANFATYDSMMTEIAKNLSNNDKKAAVSADLPHYWFNHMLLNKLGLEEYKNFDGTKKFIDADAGRRAKWEQAFLDAVNEMRKIGFVGTEAVNGTEASSFYAGKRGVAIDGQWVASNVDDAQKKDATKDKIKFAPFPKVGGKTYVIGGVTTGWYITKQAWDDKAKRKLAVEYIEAQSADDVLNSYCVAGGGLPTNAKSVTPETYGGKGFASVLAKADEVLLAIDDRIPADAKAAIMGDWSTSIALPALLTATAAPTLAQVKTIFTDFYSKLN